MVCVTPIGQKGDSAGFDSTSHISSSASAGLAHNSTNNWLKSDREFC